MIIDFRRTKTPLTPLFIKDEEVEQVETYKYLGVTMDKNLDWNAHSMTVWKKLNTRLYLLKKLNSFHVDNTLLGLFYKSIIESVICFALVCWGGNVNKLMSNKIDKIITRCNKICKPDHLFPSTEILYLCKCQTKIISILKEKDHPLYNQVSFSHRSGKPIMIKCRLERYRKSFLPCAVRLL